MNQRSRDNWLAIALVGVMGLITIMTVIQQVRSQIVDPPLSSFSTTANGAQALYRWLEAIGFTVDDTVDNTFAIPESTDTVFILEPSEPISNFEWATLDAWVENGGTLLLAGQEFQTLPAFAHYDVVLRVFFVEGTPTVETPLTVQPIVSPLPVEDRVRYLDTTREGVVPLVSINGSPVILTFPMGQGRVILSSLVDPFSNLGLQEESYAELLLNLFGESGQNVWFDEWHHGVRPTQVVSNNWLQRTPIGRSILYTTIIVFVWLLLRGRNFGRPVPLRQDIVRRSPLEYVTAVANLSRRAGHRQAVLQDAHDRLKRELSTRYRLSPTLPDDEFVENLAKFHPSLDEEALLQLLNRLQKPNISEAELVQLVQEATIFEI